jgi:flagellum-specific ATP synthase
MANTIKDVMATYKESEDLINIGAYKIGSNKKIDKAIELKDDIDEMLTQQVFETYEFEETISIIEDIYNRI